MTVDPDDFKAALSQWCTGVCVITAAGRDGRSAGLTASSFTSVSLHPPLVLFCLDLESTGADVFRDSEGFLVHLLTQEQREISNLFASKQSAKFEHEGLLPGPGGAPMLKNYLALLECATHEIFPAGDHLILVGKVLAAHAQDGEPLLYFRGGYRRLAE